MTSPSSKHEIGQSKPVHWDNPEGCDAERSGKGVRDGGAHVHPWLTMSVYSKNHHNIVK